MLVAYTTVALTSSPYLKKEYLLSLRTRDTSKLYMIGQQ